MEAAQHFNAVALCGTLTSDPTTKTLPSGTTLAQLELTTRLDGVAASVPVVWFDPPATLERCRADADVVVTGMIRRRFFRAGGSTQSRTEVVAHQVVPATQRKRVRRALQSLTERSRGEGSRSDDSCR